MNATRKLDYSEVLKRANQIYGILKTPDGALPTGEHVIRSDQVKAVLAALVEAINEQGAA